MWRQRIVGLLYRWLLAAVGEDGLVLFAPIRLQVAPAKFREPDLMLFLASRFDLRGDAYWRGADLVIEVVSPSDARRDLETKQAEYAAAEIAECWIVDPRDRSVTRLGLPNQGGEYAEVTRATRGDIVSRLLPKFVVAVEPLFASAE